MNDIYQILRTVSIYESSCQPYNVSHLRNDFNTPNISTDHLAIIVASDDLGFDEGDYSTIHKMHNILMTDNDLFKVLENKIRNVLPNYYTYSYIVITKDPNYLSEFFNLVHIQSKLDKAQYIFNEKYGVSKKRKYDD